MIISRRVFSNEAVSLTIFVSVIVSIVTDPIILSIGISCVTVACQ